MSYEYQFLVTYVDTVLQPERLTLDEMGQEVRDKLAPLGVELSTILEADFEGWEVVSHALTPIGSHLTASFLLRREKS